MTKNAPAATAKRRAASVAGRKPAVAQTVRIVPSPTPRPSPEPVVEPVPVVESVVEPVPVVEKPRLFTRRRIVAGVVVLLLLGVAGFAGWQWYRQNQLQSARDDAAGAAGQYAMDLTNYDYSKIDENFKKVAANSTPNFTQQYQAVTTNLTSVLAQYKAVSKSKLVQTGVVTTSEDRAVVLLAVDQTITNTNSPQSRVERNRMQLTVLKQDGKWRLDDVQLI